MSMNSDESLRIAAVVIGRNEGARLRRCLESVRTVVDRIVYVDSGSTDGSPEFARSIGAEIVMLDLTQPFTAARARNAGLNVLRSETPPDYVQFIDGDCELLPGWVEQALTFLILHRDVAAVSGRLREQFPENSIYNRLCDREWNTPIGKVRSCGGIALMRWTSLEQVGGFNAALIAGEEPELCIRLRVKGWEIWKLDLDMALHDAALTRLGQWWTRMRRGGYAAAEGMAMHGGSPERHGVASVLRALVWGVALPGVTMAGLSLTPWALLVVLVWPAQIVRLAMRDGGDQGAWEAALFSTLSKFPEAQGVLEYLARRIRGRPAGLIEYK